MSSSTSPSTDDNCDMETRDGGEVENRKRDSTEKLEEPTDFKKQKAYDRSFFKKKKSKGKKPKGIGAPKRKSKPDLTLLSEDEQPLSEVAKTTRDIKKAIFDASAMVDVTTKSMTEAPAETGAGIEPGPAAGHSSAAWSSKKFDDIEKRVREIVSDPEHGSPTPEEFVERRDLVEAPQIALEIELPEETPKEEIDVKGEIDAVQEEAYSASDTN